MTNDILAARFDSGMVYALNGTGIGCRSKNKEPPMVYLILLGLGLWAVVATVACLSVCMSAARFNHRAELDAEPDPEPGLRPMYVQLDAKR
jgi:hypothetical protein